MTTAARRLHLLIAGALLGTAVLTGPVFAQSAGFQLGIGAYASQPRLGLRQGALSELMSGTWTGGAARVGIGPFAVRGYAAIGTLSPSDTFTVLTRDAAEAGAELDLWLLPGFALTGGVRLRGYVTDVGTQTWKMIRAGIRVAAPLGSNRVRGFLSAAFLPSVSVTGQPSPKLAFDADVGIVAAPLPIPLEFMVGYRFERFDFGSAPADRVEELASVYAGVSLGRVW